MTLPGSDKAQGALPAIDLDHERRLLRLVSDALERPSAARPAFVEATCEDDPDLAAEALALLAAEDDLDDFLEQPAAEAITSRLTPPEGARSIARHPATLADPDAVPGRIGPYRLREKIGEGGMGQVYLATQSEPVERTVALKLMRPSFSGRQARARFQAERQALARLSHRNIARFYDSGSTDDGRPYFVMELVSGMPVTRYCDQRRLGVDARLHLFLAVCRGVTHAHQKQLIHRDLKPSNILVLQADGEPVPKIIDFGIAKALDGSLADETMLTGAWFPGAPAYMSPEAITGGETAELDTRSDVYSLGILLYELLVGARPFGDGESSPMEVLRRIEREEPRSPSACLRSMSEAKAVGIAGSRRETRSGLQRRLSGDLDCIVGKAVAKERDQRYESAAALARDVERHLGDEPVEARPPSAVYRMRKLYRRHRVAASMATALVAVVIAGLIATLLALGRAREAERQALREAARADHVARLESQSRNEAESATGFLVELFRGADPWREGDAEISARELLERGAHRLESEGGVEPLPKARLVATIGRIFLDLDVPSEAGHLLRQALELREAELGAWDLQVAESLDDLGAWHLGEGRAGEAAALHRRSLSIAEVHGGAGAERKALGLFRLGNALAASGEFGGAENAYRESIVAFDTLVEARPLARARSLENLALVVLERGRAVDAEALFARAKASLEAELGANSPEVAIALANLGSALARQGKKERAAGAFLQSLAILESSLGEDAEATAEIRRRYLELPVG